MPRTMGHVRTGTYFYIFAKYFFISGGNYTIVTCILYTTMVTHSECEISQSWRTQFSSHDAFNPNRAVMPPFPYCCVISPIHSFVSVFWDGSYTEIHTINFMQISDSTICTQLSCKQIDIIKLAISRQTENSHNSYSICICSCPLVKKNTTEIHHYYASGEQT